MRIGSVPCIAALCSAGLVLYVILFGNSYGRMGTRTDMNVNEFITREMNEC